MSTIPADRLYTRSHEWVLAEGGLIAIGITDHAQHELGDLVYVDPAQVGKKVRPGDSIGSLESVKAASDVYAPIAGTVTTSNRTLFDDPSLLNSDPYGQSLVILLPDSAEDLSGAGLMDADAYAAFLGAKG